MAGISCKSAGSLENKKRYNGIEHTTDLDLNQYDAFYRTLDSQIGRFWQIDPRSENLESYSPYESMGDDPINNQDPLGDFRNRIGAWLYKIFHGGGTVGKNEFGEWYILKTSAKMGVDGNPIITGSINYGKGRHKHTAAGEEIADEQEYQNNIDQLVRIGVLERVATQEEANRNNLRAFVGVLLPNFAKLGTLKINLPKIEKLKIIFGKNANQIYHTFRHTDEMGLARDAVQKAIEEHLPTVASQIVEGKPLNQVIEVAGQKIQYTAYKLADGTINVGRIHAAN